MNKFEKLCLESKYFLPLLFGLLAILLILSGYGMAGGLYWLLSSGILHESVMDTILLVLFFLCGWYVGCVIKKAFDAHYTLPKSRKTKK